MKRLKNNTDRILLTGNEAVAEGALRARCTFYAGYPITPQNELTAYMAHELPKRKGVFIQAESEIAAINMVFGAAASGARAMTSSSSPGISLKQEGISYIAGAQLPAVIVNVMRSGPGLGGIGPSQSDYFQAVKGGGHGDYRVIVLAPSSVQEAFELTRTGFDLADVYRNPVMILTDAFLGQMAEPANLKDIIPSSQVPKKPWALSGARARKQNIVRSFFMREEDLQFHNHMLQAKYARIARTESRAQALNTLDADIILVAYGISYRIAKEAMREYDGKEKIGIFRPITLWPYPAKQLLRACRKAETVIVCELSSGQMVEDVQRITGKEKNVFFFGRMGGGVFTSGDIIKYIKRIVRRKRP